MTREGFTRSEHHLLDWLSREDESLIGECHGADLDRLTAEGLVERKRTDPRGELYSTVGLTEAGYRTAKALGAWEP